MLKVRAVSRLTVEDRVVMLDARIRGLHEELRHLRSALRCGLNVGARVSSLVKQINTLEGDAQSAKRARTSGGPADAARR